MSSKANNEAANNHQEADLPGTAPIFEIDTSRNFTAWLKEMDISLAFTTYQVGKLFMIGTKPDGKLWVYNRNIGRCLGLAARGKELWVSSDTQIYRFVDAIEAGQKTAEGYDAVYVPQVSYFTGDVDCHDIALSSSGNMVFVNTLFNCVASVSSSHSFTPLWRPDFISKLAAEDRCHLNGVALKHDSLGYVTAVARSDTFDGWRGKRTNGGIVIDANSNEIVASGLSMPHSPRWYQEKLWLHNSGTGEFGYIDLADGRFVPIAFCPGYLRGLAFVGKYALAGLSKPRENKTFSGLALDEALHARAIDARCGLYVINLQTGDIVHSLTISGIVSELYDVVVLPRKNQPALIGPNSPELSRMISVQ